MSFIHSKKTTLALVGPDLQENLTFGYLAAATESAGYSTNHVRFNTSGDQSDCVNTIMRLKPDVVGMGIAFQYSVHEYIDLAVALRNSGFSGHITCGGHVPTFSYEDLLKDVKAFDTVVRHEGEQTLVELLQMIEDGISPKNILGLVWRKDNSIVVNPPRPFVKDLDTLKRPKRKREAMVAAGAPISFVIGSRGCIGDCAYCSIRAFSRDAGGPFMRQRSCDSVAEEIADLYHKQNVRIILLQDDLFLMPSEKKSIERMKSLGKAVKDRGANDALFWIKARPETITPPVIEAAREMGVIHIFLGVESACVQRLRYLGRSHKPEDNDRAISLCLKNGIRPSFNLMLFDPDCTLDEVSQSIDFGERYLSVTWNICRTEIFPGTKLFSRLKEEGRLEGNYKTYGYQIRDQAAEIAFRIMRVCFFERSFNFDSLMNRMISLSFSRQVQDVYLQGPTTDDISARVDNLVTEINFDTINEIRRIIDFATMVSIDELDKIRDFSIETALAINERNSHWQTRYEDLLFLLNARGEKIRTQGVLQDAHAS